MKNLIIFKLPLGKFFYLIQYSALLNSIASRCLYFALAWWMLTITNNTLAFASFVMASSAADIFARGCLGSLGDHYNKHKLISICYWMSLIASFAIVLLVINHSYWTFILFFCQIILGLSIGLREPLQNSIIPSLVNKEQLSNAIQWKSAANSIAFFCSPILGTGLVSLIGVQNTIIFSLGLILISIVLLNWTKLYEQNFNIHHIVQRPKWYSGFSTIKNLPPETSLIKITFFMNLGLFPFLSVALPAFFHKNYADRPWLFGIVDTFFAAGMFIGSTKFATFANSLVGRAVTTYVGYFSLGIGILITAMTGQTLSHYSLIFFSLMCFGMSLAGCGLMIAVSNTSFMRSAASPQHYLNRISASSTFSTGIASPLGVMLAGMLISSISIDTTLILLSLILIIASLCSIFSTNLRDILSLPDEQIHGAYQRFYPHAFSKDLNVSSL